MASRREGISNMASKVSLRLCLLGFTLFLASVSVGLGEESEGAGGGVGVDGGCLTHCEELKGNVVEFATCEKGCELSQRGRQPGRVSPRREFEVCQRRCQTEGHEPEQQRRCQQRCQEQLREREQREGRDHDDGEDYRRDPERAREDQRRREHEREERRRREREREHGRGRGRDENERDPEREREERRREQERRERERQSERRGQKDEEENERDPEREREERRREQERKEQEQRRREQERRERERQSERRGQRDEEENERDPEREREERRREQERKEQEQRRREQERRERERQSERRGQRDEEENERDPEREREERRREQERKEQEQRRRERERRGERDEDDNRRDPEREREWRREQEERRREQERREREREHGRGRGRDDNSRDPQRQREERRREQERREQEERRREWEREGHEWERERGRGRGRNDNPRDPQREWEERRQGGQEEQRRREEERERAERRRERQHGGGRVNQVETRREEQEQRSNPFYFQAHRFQSRFRSDEGHWRVLEKFSERSELLRGIKNQRIAILEARPQTFIVPHHVDAECVLLVVKGRTTITTVYQEKKETRKQSYNLERGDVMNVPAGTTVYLINNENEDLQIVTLYQPVNNPGEFKDYLSAGGESQSYYSVFSNDVLEAALNVPRDQLDRIFKQRSERRGKIIRASQEQLRSLSQQATSTRKGGRGTRAPIKLESQTPVYSNQHGQMFEACPDEFPQLRNTDVAATVVDIKEGGMMVPHFNSKATWVLFVSEGVGSFEMACPHLQGEEWQRGRGEEWQRGRGEERRHGRREEEEEREGGSSRFQRVTGRLTPGGVLVVPAGHPIAIIASKNENLRLVGFVINAEENRRNFLAGKYNIMNEVDREAKELAFDIEGKQAEEIFRSQKESFFTEGPEGGQRRQSERRPLLSILKLAGYL